MSEQRLKKTGQWSAVRLMVLAAALVMVAPLLPTGKAQAQCLGEDCSIKGRNKARKQKTAKMTGSSRARSGVNKARKVKRGGSAYDPFSNNSQKKMSAQGFDPFEAEKKRKLKNKRGKANDAWLTTQTASVVSGGFDGWDDGIKPKKPKKGGGIWANSNTSYKSPKRQKVRRGGSRWDLAMDATTFGGGEAGDRVGSYDMESWSDFSSAAVSHDISYKNPHQWKFSGFYGTQLKTGSTAKALMNATKPGAVVGGEIAVEWPTTGEKNYHHYFNLPTLGVGVGYLNMGDNDVLGHCAYALPYANIPIVRTRPVDLYVGAGMGIAYLSKWNDGSDCQNTAEENYLTGSPVNAVVKGSLGLNFRPVTKATDERRDEWSRFTFTLALDGYHFGNLSIEQPNKGLNVVGGSFSIKYLTSDPEYLTRRNADDLPHIWTIDVSGGGGLKQQAHRDRKHYGVASASLQLKRRVANALRLGIGGDFFFDNSWSEEHTDCTHYKYAGKYDPTKASNQFRIGGSVGAEIDMGRWSYLLDAGYYLFNPVDISGEKWYVKHGVAYHFSKNVFGLLNVKAHGWNVDFATLGLGYRLPL